MKQAMQVLTSSEMSEWYTPPKFIEAARSVMGNIDLDPASCWAANQWIEANQFYNKEDGGLVKQWHGNIFSNPPYGKTGAQSNQDIWARKLEEEFHAGRVRQGILLTKCVPGYVWWERLFRRWTVCFVRERIEFLRLNEHGRIVSSGKAKAGTNFWYVGEDSWKFRLVFKRFGRMIEPPIRGMDL